MKKITYLFCTFCVLLCSSLFAQTSVSGTVIDQEGNPIPGATIIVSGTSQGTTTDFDGNFTLNVAGDASLDISSIGFQTQTIAVNNQSNLSIVLVDDISELDEVFVTGYSSQSRKSITGAVAIVDVGALENLPDQSVLNQLQGRVTGVQIGKSGGPGGVPQVRIRGYANVSTNSNPLYVIDGVQTNSAEVFNLINPSDIESIQILKDASSAAIYGSRANNGVVIVTTKKGKKGADKVSFNINLSSAYQTPRKEAFPDFITPQQYADYLWLQQTNAGNDSPSHLQYGTGSSPVLPNYLTPAGSSTADLSTYALVPGPDNNPIKLANKQGTDWIDEIFAPNFLNTINISAGKSTEDSNFYISSNLSSNRGILRYTSFDRYSLRANSDFKVGDRFTFGESLTVAYSERKGSAGNQEEGGPINQAHRIQPIVPVRDVEGNFAGTAGGGLGNGSNPVAALYRDRNDIARTIRALGNFYGIVHFSDDLNFKSSFGFDYSSTSSSDLIPQRLEDQEQQTTNRFTEWNGVFSETTFSNTLNYSTSFGDHTIKPLIGIEFNVRKNRTFFGYRSNFASESQDFLYLDAGPAGDQFNGGGGSQVFLFSYLSKIDYTYKDKFFASASARIDQSSRYLKENRTGVFPTVGLAWRLSEEQFVQDLDIFDNMRLRLAWGQSGNSETPTGYPTASSFGLNGTTNNYDIGGTSSSALTGYASSIDGNPNLKWETAETFDLALEFGLLNNDLNIEVGYYNKISRDLLVRLTRPATAGLAEDPFVNIGESSNKGVEFAINYNGELSDGLGIQAGINMSFNKTEVTGLNPDNADQFLPTFDFRGNTITRIQKGYPISYFYGYDVEGFYSNQAEVDALEQSNGVVGGFKYRDVDGDGKITGDDRTQIGSPHPDAIYGINLGFTYNQFALSLFADGTIGNEIYDFKKYFTDLHFFPGTLKTSVLDSWSPSNPNATVPLISNNVTGQELPSSFYVEDGSYLRMRNINLSYTLPNSVNSSLNIAAAKIYFQVDNAFVITNYSGLDPEINVLNDPNNPRSDQNLGIDRGAYPNPRSFILGVNISLH